MRGCVSEGSGFHGWGGDTTAAIEKFGISGKVDYISIKEEAFLEYVEWKELPANLALKLG